MEDNLRPPRRSSAPPFPPFPFFSLPTSVTRAHARRRPLEDRAERKQQLNWMPRGRVIYDSSFRLDGSRRIRPRNTDETFLALPPITNHISPKTHHPIQLCYVLNAVSSHVDGKFFIIRDRATPTNGKRTNCEHHSQVVRWEIFFEFSVSGQKRRKREEEKWFSTMVENDLARPAIVTKTRAGRGTNFTPKNARIKDKGREISRVKAA